MLWFLHRSPNPNGFGSNFRIWDSSNDPLMPQSSCRSCAKMVSKPSINGQDILTTPNGEGYAITLHSIGNT